MPPESATAEATNRLEATIGTDFVSKPSVEGPAVPRDQPPPNLSGSGVGSTEAAAALSPRISSVSWGHIEVEGVGKLKDAKLWPGGGRAWDWGETGTRHKPGIQMAEIEELLNHGATVIVLSRGMEERLGVPESTVDALRARGVKVHVAETRAAVALYNDLLATAPVAGLFHSTC